MLLEHGDVGVHGDKTAILGASFANLYPLMLASMLNIGAGHNPSYLKRRAVQPVQP